MRLGQKITAKISPRNIAPTLPAPVQKAHSFINHYLYGGLEESPLDFNFKAVPCFSGAIPYSNLVKSCVI